MVLGTYRSTKNTVPRSRQCWRARYCPWVSAESIFRLPDLRGTADTLWGWVVGVQGVPRACGHRPKQSRTDPSLASDDLSSRHYRGEVGVDGGLPEHPCRVDSLSAWTGSLGSSRRMRPGAEFARWRRRNGAVEIVDGGVEVPGDAPWTARSIGWCVALSYGARAELRLIRQGARLAVER